MSFSTSSFRLLLGLPLDSFHVHWLVPTVWTVRGSNPGGGEIFRTCSDRPCGLPSLLYNGCRVFPRGRARSEPGGTRWRTGGEVKGKEANGMGSQYNSTLPRNVVCPALLPLLLLIRTPRLPVVDWTDAPTDLNGLVSFGEDELWFLRVCHHVLHEL